MGCDAAAQRLFHPYVLEERREVAPMADYERIKIDQEVGVYAFCKHTLRYELLAHFAEDNDEDESEKAQQRHGNEHRRPFTGRANCHQPSHKKQIAKSIGGQRRHENAYQ